ncbi:MAG: hypothetical protein U5L09_01655 [Bacteroidales bacterium]|nr:hypothetical protein [Bacteroidales bacterium]
MYPISTENPQIKMITATSANWIPRVRSSAKSGWKDYTPPKGMVITNGYLYVTDIDRIAKVDIQQGTIVKYISVEGSSFLNDMEVLDNKNLHQAIWLLREIFILDRDEVAVFKEQGLKQPNGMLTSGPFFLTAIRILF